MKSNGINDVPHNIVEWYTFIILYIGIRKYEKNKKF